MGDIKKGEMEHVSIRLKDGLNLNELIQGEGTTFEVNFDGLNTEEDKLAYEPREVFQHLNSECSRLVDEDTYEEGEPFVTLAAKMTNVLDDGKIKKRILRKGYGDVLPDKCMVTIDYNAYLEYNEEPFDSTYVRKKPLTFLLNDHRALLAIDLAVQSMRLDEKSQFLVHHDYAYGELGCNPRIPPKSTILYEIEVKNCVDSGAAITYQNLSQEQQNEFVEIYKYAHALCSKGNDLYSKGLTKQAIKEYNIAVSKLEMCRLRDYDDQLQQQQLLLRLRTNLVVAHTKVQEPRRACINCNKIYNMCKGTGLKIPVKVYFNHARSLMLLSDFAWAERQLKSAYRLEPQNKDITKEFIKLDAKRKECYDREKALAQAIFRNTKPNGGTPMSKEFQESIIQYCKDLTKDKERKQYSLPKKLTKDELEFAEKEAAKHGLEFKYSESKTDKKYVVAKPSNVEQNK